MDRYARDFWGRRPRAEMGKGVGGWSDRCPRSPPPMLGSKSLLRSGQVRHDFKHIARWWGEWRVAHHHQIFI